jgi:hypothetical protein
MPTGVGALQNDAAAEWLQFLLVHVDDAWLVDTALDGVARGDGRTDLKCCQQAMAAAEVVAAAGRKPHPDVDDDLLAWVEPRWTALWNGNRRAALSAVKIMLESSALLKHWRAAGDFEAWKQSVEDLRERLS